MFDAILKLEIDQIVWLQDVCQPIEGFLEIFSAFAKSSALNVYVLPLCLAFDVHLYTSLLLVSSLTGYATHMLKWLLADSRPYWWVQQTDAYNAHDAIVRPQLRQTEITCETSAGNPSGHVMLSAACLYVLADRVLRERRHCRWLAALVWSVYAFGIGMVTVSRMYYACHYLHQCALGAVLGFACARFLVRSDRGSVRARLWTADRWGLAMLGGVMAALAVLLYVGQLAVGVDPLWSIRTAFNWCENPFYVRPETTTVHCIVRDLGLFFGLVFAAPLASRCVHRLDIRYSLPAVTAIVVAYAALVSNVPRQHGVLVFYASTFVLNAFIVYGSIAGVVKLCKIRSEP